MLDRYLLRIFFGFTLLLAAGCAPVRPPLTVEEIPLPEEISYEFSEDGKTVTIRVPHGVVGAKESVDDLLSRSRDQIKYEEYFSQVETDSLRTLLSAELESQVDERIPSLYTLEEVRSSAQFITVVLDEDDSRVALLASELMKLHEVRLKEPPVAGLPPAPFHDDFLYLKGISIPLPCPGVGVPENPYLLPNAPRPYRSGTHRGIDFPAPYGAEVRSVADGIVIRADHDYQEITSEFRESLLAKAAFLGHTPSDVFEHILLGRSVFIDHGMDVVPGKRLVSIYAHLSAIDESIRVGQPLHGGQTLGLCGNSGTSDGATGTTEGAHLHWELLIQDEEGERYMGQGMEYNELNRLLTAVFQHETPHK